MNTTTNASPPSNPSGWMGRFLSIVERGGNALPHPATLFILFAALIILVSEIAARAGLSAPHPRTGEEIRALSLLSIDGLHRILEKTVTNLTGFAPLGTVLVAMLGIGIAESSGLIGASMRKLVFAAPPKLLTVVVVFAGVMSNVASEIGYVLLVPMAALVFQAAGRHPIAGLAAAFAGVSGGYSANLLLGTVDPLLSGITQEAGRIVQPDLLVNPACNYYFMFVSTFLIAFVGTWITERVVEPRLGTYQGSSAKDDSIRPLDASEKRGLLCAGLASLVFAAILLAGTVPASGFLRNATNGELLHSPFMSGIVTLVFAGGAIAGIAYGVGARTIKNDTAVMNGMGKTIATLGSYIVLVFFAAQFVAYFNWSNLGILFAVKGAAWLKASGLEGIPVMIAFVFLTAFVNLFMGSASAKWALMAPVFVPMFLLLGYPPETTQCAFRIGDSCTNIISPMMSYFALIIAFFQRHDAKAGIGTLIATMLPYSLAFLASWIVLFAVWLAFDLPLGPR